MPRLRSVLALACAMAMALALAGAALAQGQKRQIEKGSSIGTPLPVEKVEAALLAPQLSEEAKAALAKLVENTDQLTTQLAGYTAQLADNAGQMTRLIRWLVLVGVGQLVVLGLQLWLLRLGMGARRRAAPAAAPAALPAAEPAREAASEGGREAG
ncbi:MAG: hypothetical protein ACHQF3_05720 [Alphaproteobacteria bacterium]